jgi:hypothetical protein
MDLGFTMAFGLIMKMIIVTGVMAIETILLTGTITIVTVLLDILQVGDMREVMGVGVTEETMEAEEGDSSKSLLLPAEQFYLRHPVLLKGWLLRVSFSVH